MDFRLLGPVTVVDENGGRQVSARRQRAILALLLLNSGQVLSASRLVEEVWEGRPPEAAAGTLHTYVMRLRRALGPRAAERLRTRHPGYLVELEDGELDVDRFRRLRAAGWEAARRGDHAAAADHLALAIREWRGDPLADLPDIAERQVEVAILREQRLQACEWLFESELRLGRHAEILPEVRHFALEHPLRERFIGQLITALYRCHQRADALAVFRRTRADLIDQVGIEPGDELARIHLGVLNDDLPGPISTAVGGAPATRPNQLPVDTDCFTGRTDEVREAVKVLLRRTERPAVVAVTGPGGIGKSAFAVNVARRVMADFPDGQLYVDLRGSSPRPRPAGEILERLLRDLGVDKASIPADEEDRAAVYRTAVAGRRLLIIIDDVRDAKSLRPLIPGDGGCAVIAVSRNRLTAITDARRVELPPLSAEAGLWLFSQLAGSSHVATDPAAVGRVLQLCSGSPLAIRIAAARLATSQAQTVGMLAESLADSHQRLAELAVDDLSVREVFAGARSQLGPAHAGVFDLLGAVLGQDSCTELTADAASRLLGLSQAATARMLDHLAAAYLLEIPIPGRYRFHDLVKPYAFESSESLDAETAQAAATRLTRWALARVVAADALIAPVRKRVPPHPLLDEPAGFAALDEALAWFEANREGVVATIVEACQTGLDAAAWRLAVAAWSFFYVRGYLQDLLLTSEYAVAAARRADDPYGEAWVRNGMGTALYDLGRVEEARAAFQETLAIRRRVGDHAGAGYTLNNLAVVETSRQRYREAEELFRGALREHERGDNPAGVAMTLNNFGESLLLEGSGERALAELQAALPIRRELGDRRGAALTMQGIGKVLAALHRTDEARRALVEARDIFRETGDIRNADETTVLIENL